MSGKVSQIKLKRFFKRYSFTIIFFITGIILPAIILFAIVDFVNVAKSKDAQVHSAALKSDLSQFVLALREDDNAALAAFPVAYASSQRTLQAVPLAQPIFTYFLRRGNAKTFESKSFRWGAPVSCSIDYVFSSPLRAEEEVVRACLGYLPQDSTGAYLYFSLRYPIKEISRHEQGRSFSSADHIELDLRSMRRKTRLQLVYEPATLAIERYPSQRQRFEGLHEVTGFLGDDPKHPSRAVSGQGFEHVVRDSSGKEKRFVTLLVRVDSSIVLSQEDSVDGAPPSLRPVHAAVAIYKKDRAEKKASLAFEIPYERRGLAVMSLERLYLETVSTKASLALNLVDEHTRQLWRSDSISEEILRPSGFQAASDKWAEWIVSLFGYTSQEAAVSQQISRDSRVIAELRQKGVLLPDVATRSFLYLTAALVVIMVALVYWTISLLHLRRIFKIAYLITVRTTSDMRPIEHERGNGEITRLGRVVSLLIARHRSRAVLLQKRVNRERNEQIERSRIEKEHVRNRKAILDAIGHEIKSPLQSLATKIPVDSDARRHVERMNRAVVALDLATSVESGLQASMMVNKYEDVAVYISTFAKNTAEEGIVYDGPANAVIAFFDPLALDIVFEHIFSNASRFKTPGSSIRISLNKTLTAAQIEIYNDGPLIDAGKEEAIFDLGVSSKTENGNLGQGLFAARAQMVGMKGSISAVNRDSGVAFILLLSLMPE